MRSVLKSLGKCQDHFEYNELWLHKLVEQVRKTCTTPCLPQDFDKLSRKWHNIIKELPECQNIAEDLCFYKAFKKAQPDVRSRSCTRMHYKTVHTINGNEDQNRAAFTIDFLDPPVVAVKEEYLVYDGVALISSVGGLLGICVGISFHGFSGVILRYLQVIFDWAKRQRRGDSKSP